LKGVDVRATPFLPFRVRTPTELSLWTIMTLTRMELVPLLGSWTRMASLACGETRLPGAKEK
jgi:hypothetical protein